MLDDFYPCISSIAYSSNVKTKEIVVNKEKYSLNKEEQIQVCYDENTPCVSNHNNNSNNKKIVSSSTHTATESLYN